MRVKLRSQIEICVQNARLIKRQKLVLGVVTIGWSTRSFLGNHVAVLHVLWTRLEFVAVQLAAVLYVMLWLSI
jgi:hypothetical protein